MYIDCQKKEKKVRSIYIERVTQRKRDTWRERKGERESEGVLYIH